MEGARSTQMMEASAWSGVAVRPDGMLGLRLRTAISRERRIVAREHFGHDTNPLTPSLQSSMSIVIGGLNRHPETVEKMASDDCLGTARLRIRVEN